MQMFIFSLCSYILTCFCLEVPLCVDFEPKRQQKYHLNTNDAVDSILTSRKLKEYMSVCVCVCVSE